MSFRICICAGILTLFSTSICSRVASASIGSNCAGVLSGTESVVKSISLKEMYDWTEAEWNINHGKFQYYTDDSQRPKFQEILFIEDFSLDEQASIQEMLQISFAPEIIQASFDFELQRRLKWYINIDGFTLSEKEELAKDMAEGAVKNGVETGFYRLVMNDGSILKGSVWSAKKASQILGVDLGRGLDLLWNSNNIHRNHVARLQFFHFHPTLGPLSDEDMRFLEVLQEAVSSRELVIPTHIYAAMKWKGRLRIFHAKGAFPQKAFNNNTGCLPILQIERL